MTLSPDVAVGRGFRKLGSGEALARVIGFVATAILARRLGADDYGTIVLAMTVLAYLGRVVDAGVDLLGISDVAAAPEELPNFLRRYTLARLFIALALIVLLVVVAMAFLPEPDDGIIAAFAFMLPAYALGTRWAHLGLERAGTVSVVRLSAEMASALLLTLVVQGPGNLGSVPAIMIAGESLAAFLLLRLLPRVALRLRETWSAAQVLRLYRRSWPLVLNSLIGLVTFNSDFVFLRVMRDSAAVGYYAAAYAMISFFMNMGNAYQLMMLPVLARVRTDAVAERELYHASFAQVFAIIFPVVIGGSLLAAPIIAMVFGAAYDASVLPLRILLWAVLVSLIRNVAQSVLIARERQDKLLRYAVAAGIVNLVLNAILIPRWGMTAAATVTAVTETVRTVPMLLFLRGAGMPVPSVRRFWKTVAASGVMAVVVLLAGIGTVWVAIPLGVVTYALVLFVAGGIRVHRDRLPELIV